MREADELSECRIKNSQRVRKINALVDVEFVASSKSERSAAKISKTIDGETGGFIKSGNKKCGSKMSQMMLDVMNLRADRELIMFFKCLLERRGAAHAFDSL